MSEGDVVSFTDCQMHLYNAEFFINNNKNWRIWFSQLNMFLYNGTFDGSQNGLQVCTFKLKSGNYITPYNMEYADFWEKIKGKRFKVVDVTPCYKPNPNNSEVRIMTIAQVYQKVHNALINGNGESVRGMLKPQKCYDLEEI